MPITIDRLPRLDVVLISHNHYDHLDYNSIKHINNRFSGLYSGLKWFVGSGNLEWFRSCGIEGNVYELKWWETKEYSNLTFAFTPAQHWSYRGRNDRFKVIRKNHYP